MKTSLTLLLLFSLLSPPVFANEWPCKSQYESVAQKYDQNTRSRDTLTAVGWFTYGPSALVGSFVVLAPLTGGLTLLAAPVLTVMSYAGIVGLLNVNERRVRAYDVLSSADFTQADLDANYRDSIIKYRQGLLNDSATFNALWNERNAEEVNAGRVPLTREEMSASILNAPIGARPDSAIDEFVHQFSTRLHRTVTFEEVRQAVLGVRNTPAICEKHPLTYKQLLNRVAKTKF